MLLLAEADLAELSAIDIFEGCTPEKIAALYEAHLKESGAKDPAMADAEARMKPHIPTANQVSLIDYTIFSPKKVSVNLPILYKFPLSVDADRLCEAYNKVIANHPIYAYFLPFRTSEPVRSFARFTHRSEVPDSSVHKLLPLERKRGRQTCSPS